jgi:hypothetical protein
MRQLCACSMGHQLRNVDTATVFSGKIKINLGKDLNKYLLKLAHRNTFIPYGSSNVCHHIESHVNLKFKLNFDS